MNMTKSDVLLKKDRESIWHHLSPYNEKAPPLVAVEADGAWITDHHGKKFLDGMAGLWCVNVGYGREELAKAAYEQMKKMPYFPLTQSHVPAIKLSEKLNEWLDDEYVFFYSNSGSDANEVAFKIARQYHQQNGDPSRYKFISRYRAYHGVRSAHYLQLGKRSENINMNHWHKVFYMCVHQTHTADLMECQRKNLISNVHSK